MEEFFMTITSDRAFETEILPVVIDTPGPSVVRIGSVISEVEIENAEITMDFKIFLIMSLPSVIFSS